MDRYLIVRDDGERDRIAGLCFTRYDDAHAVLERYYADLCCSDERQWYRIERLEGREGGSDDGGPTAIAP
ncbi:MAG: hypothetical protein ACKO0M_10350 [Cyanobium sp.]